MRSETRWDADYASDRAEMYGGGEVHGLFLCSAHGSRVFHQRGGAQVCEDGSRDVTGDHSPAWFVHGWQIRSDDYGDYTETYQSDACSRQCSC